MGNEKSIQLAENLQKLMREKNLTITSASRKIKMNKSTLHNYCNGVIPRNLMKLQELADLLGVTLSELASGKAQASALPSFPEDLEERFEVTIKRLGKNIP